MRADDISLRARQIHFSSIVFDTHADTPQRFLFDQFDMGHRDAEGCVDIPRLGKAAWARSFSRCGCRSKSRALQRPRARSICLTPLRSNSAACGRSDTGHLCEEIRRAREQNKIAILLGVEGGHAINDDLEVLREFFARGVRYMTLTHNAATDWADSSNGLRDTMALPISAGKSCGK